MGLEIVELILEIEKHFSIRLPDQELEKTETVESLCKLIRAHCVQQKGFNASSYATIYQYLVTLLKNDFGVELDQIHPHSKFVKDLGLD